MYRLLPALTLIPAIFTFVAIILINVGGINSYSQPRNTAFRLVSWNYTITPLQSYTSYTNTVYLSRLCYSQTARSSSGLPALSLIEQCPKAPSGRKVHDYDFRRIRNVRIFNFDTLYLDAPFAMYILAALCLVGAMLIAIFSVFSSSTALRRNGGRKSDVPLLGMVVSLLTFMFLLIGSAVITYQMTHLYDQILHNTASFVRTFNYGTNSTLTVRLNSVTLGTTVLGLTWGAVAAMLINCVLWGVAWQGARSSLGAEREGKEEPPRYELPGKDGRHVEGGL